ncbi:helix-turn-helix domain-containing protein [Clostridium tyrobutyricum]|uniref:helix-turn-helix domain-containing protein n=1 Tax=Clostridium tyrobutyricum TaxID=1519 RepID=UPI0018A0089C|nr:helix-turn-helix transcriptional regulator [Clostridium tyrobutyricum]
MLGDKIKKLRENQSLTQIQLAESINADISTISKIENNRSNPSLPMLYKIAKVLDCTPDELIKDTEIKSFKLNSEETKEVV